MLHPAFYEWLCGHYYTKNKETMMSNLPYAVEWVMNRRANPVTFTPADTLSLAEIEALASHYDLTEFRKAHPNGCTVCLGSGWTEMDSLTGVSEWCPKCLCEGRCPRCGSESVEYVERDWCDAAVCTECGYKSSE